MKKAAKIYDEQLRREVNEEREKLGKKPVDDDGSNDGGTVEKTVSTTDPECDRNGFVIGLEVTSGNVSDSRRTYGRSIWT